MKKSFYAPNLLSLVAFAATLAACAGIERSPEAADLIQLKGEPIGCEYLYKIEVEKSAFSKESADIHLENRIAAQAQRGNAYWLISTHAEPKRWTPLGYETVYMMTANVYKCPDRPDIIIKSAAKSSGKNSGQADKQVRK